MYQVMFLQFIGEQGESSLQSWMKKFALLHMANISIFEYIHCTFTYKKYIYMNELPRP